MNFQELGIGGLDAEFNEIFRRAFNSRRFPQSLIDEFGIKHVKGMLLYGPPGTGKTLIARKIADALNCEKPKVVNGPEIFDKYVGESQKKIRELFKEAEEEQQEKGDESGLHVIIFDEIDAICRTRSGGGGGAGGAGGDGGHYNNKGPKGAGRASTISGSSVTLAVGGQGGTHPGGAGSSGGGGNTGGGGGGGSQQGSGGSGSSGVVYLRMATSSYSGTTSGSPTVTTSGSDTILKFTGSGSYTA